MTTIVGSWCIAIAMGGAVCMSTVDGKAVVYCSDTWPSGIGQPVPRCRDMVPIASSGPTGKIIAPPK